MLGYIIAAIVLVIRLARNDVKEYSRADETVYVIYTQRMMRGEPFAALVKEFLAGVGDTPSPLRVGWYQLCALVCRMRGSGVNHRYLATLSAVFSAAGALVAYDLARPYGMGAAADAALLVAISPISQAMGRRALQDSAVGTLTAFAFMAACTGNWALTAAACTLLLFVKDVSVLGWPGFAVSFFMCGGKVAYLPLAFGLPIVAFVSTLGVANGGLKDLWRVVQLLSKQEVHAYSMSFGRGPAHLYLLQFATLSPVVAALVVRGWTLNGLTAGLAIYVATWSVLRFKNYRFFTGADICLRVVAAVFVSSMSLPLQVIALVACIVTDELIFRRVFLKREVYDPVVYNVEKALDMVP
jgi:hypothetical protein